MTSAKTRVMRSSPRPWTASEDAELKRMHAEGISNVSIAKELGRAQSSVAGRVKRMEEGGEFKPVSSVGWTPEDDTLILDLREEGLFAREIALRIGRTKYSVESRLSKLLSPKPENTDRKTRTCLYCQRVFMSAHSLNRICGRCRDRVADVSTMNPGIHGSI